MSLKTATQKFAQTLIARKVVKRYAVHSMQAGKWYKQVYSGGEYVYFHAENELKNGNMGGRMVRTWGRQTPKITKDSVPKGSMRLWEEVKGTPEDLQNVHLAMEHSSPDARKNYLHEHPNADPSNHTVKQKSEKAKPSSGGDTAADSSKAEARDKEVDRLYEEMKSLKKKVDNADESAKKKFNRAYSKIYDSGETAAKSAERLVKKFDHLDEDSEGGASVQMLHHALRNWRGNQLDHHKSHPHAHSKLQQAEQTWAYAKKIEEAIRNLHKYSKA